MLPFDLPPVCYDIADDKHLRCVFKTMLNYGEHRQFAVFECELTPADLALPLRALPNRAYWGWIRS